MQRAPPFSERHRQASSSACTFTAAELPSSASKHLTSKIQVGWEVQGLHKRSMSLFLCHCILWLRPSKSSVTVADEVAFQQQGESHEVTSMKLIELQKHFNESRYFLCHSLSAQMQIKCVLQTWYFMHLT